MVTDKFNIYCVVYCVKNFDNGEGEKFKVYYLEVVINLYFSRDH